MNDIEQINQQIHIITNPLSLAKQHRRSQRQRVSPEPQSINAIKQLSPLDLSDSLQSLGMTDTKINHILATISSSNTIDTNPLADQIKMTNNHFHRHNSVDQQNANLSDSLNNLDDDNLLNNSPPSSSSLKHNSLSSSDLDPYERKKQAVLAKAEGKLDKAQHLYQLAQQSVERSISEFLRATTMPGIINESNSSKTIVATFEKRIRTLQETKKKLEKKITKYQSDIARIQSGDIPHHYRSSKDIINNIKNKVANGNYKNRSSNIMSTPILHEQTITSNHQEPDNCNAQSSALSTSMNHNIEAMNNNSNFLSYSQNSNTFETMRSSPSSSTSNEIGNSQFYIDSNSEVLAINEADKSPVTKRRLTDDSNIEFYDQTSDHSNDDRLVYNASIRRNNITTAEYHQLMTKIDSIHKVIERYDTRVNDMQKQIDSLVSINDSQNQQNERLNNELTDLTDLHQLEMSTLKTDLRKLEEKLLYNLNEYWAEIIERLDKLDTRTTKVEQTQAHAFDTEENTHRLISKFVNILLTVFAIILLLLSTIKNLLQSRVHAIILLILVFTWIAFHYLPENYFQLTVLKSFTNLFT
ncbi:unnamed protein product [Rotaria socialis]|uniref:Uncharacterized protein n=2 Tax=Rotaria socialis TaxID=392032 RepID=A0A817R9S6_9BILA|nr:unnamed protein product [Rotaria socialis]CAF3480740.1 unnamed protein product [Rotaria socialis]